MKQGVVISFARSFTSIGVVVLLGCGTSPPRAASELAGDLPIGGAQPVATESAHASASSEAPPSDAMPEVKTLDTEDILVGTGATAETGKRVRMYYVGRLLDGTEFDRTRRQPFEFQLGAGEVIAGWDRGIVGMRVGGKRRLVIPAELGYGARGAPPAIPPNAALVFDVELLEVL